MGSKSQRYRFWKNEVQLLGITTDIELEFDSHISNKYLKAHKKYVFYVDLKVF